MGLLLSILFSYAGAIEFMFIVRDVVHRIGLHHEKMKFNRDQSKVTSTLHELQEDLRHSIQEARIQLLETDCIHSMADGVQYEEGYRILPANEQNAEKRWLESRAIASIEPASHMVEANDVVKSIVNEKQNNIDVTDSKRGCSNSKIKESTDNEIAIDMNHLNGNGNSHSHSNNDNNDAASEMPKVRFGEYTHDKSHDSVTKMSECQQQQQQQQNVESGRRKSFKVYSNTGSHVTTDDFQRRRSKDIDGEMDNPWGELKPENFHDANLWSRERAMSIAENEESIGCVDEKNSNNANFKRGVKALNTAAAMAVSTLEMHDNRVPIHEKKIGKSFGEPDETYESDVSSEILPSSSLPHYFDEVNPACDDDDGDGDGDGSSRAGQIRILPEILVDGLDINEIVADYTIDDNDIELDKHQFKEYFEKPNRLRHSSYNYEIDEEDNEGDLNEFSIVQKDEAEDEEGDGAVDLVSENESIDTNSVAKQGRKGRKPNMFASSFRGNGSNNNNSSSSRSGGGDHENEPRPLVRITSTEDERVEHFLQEENISNTNRGSGDILIKSKTTQMFECHDDEILDDAADSCESRANSPTSVTSPMYVTRRESMASDNGSEPPIQFECKQQQPDSPNYFYNQREDSASSNKSNVVFEHRRSESHFLELEYIKGRDDWKDDYARCSISGEIDSDNYHHLRRHSEAADTLEYIRGREDWLLRNEVYGDQQRTSLAQIFEVGEPKLLIQDEIDSDEYHHNFFQHSISEPGYAPINKLPESRKQDFQEQFVAENVGGNEISVTTNLNNAHNEHPIALPSNSIMFDKSSSSSSNIGSNEIDVVIEDLIKHDTINNDDIEITVWDLTPESHKNNPFIFISKATTATTTTTAATNDNQDTAATNDERNSNQSDDLLYPNCMDTSISTELTSNINFDSEYSSSMAMSNNNNSTTTTTTGSSSNSNKDGFLNAEIQCETKNRPHNLSDDKIEKEIENEIESNDDKRRMRAKSERIDSKTAGLLKPNEQKPRRTLSFENVEDLIEQCSNGPWFHK